MSVATIASVVAIAGTAYGAYSTSQNNKRAEAAAAGGDVSGILDDYDASDVFGRRVKAAEFQNRPYSPVDYGDVQLDTIGDNAGALPDILKLVTAINQAQRADGVLRLVDRGNELEDVG